MAKISFNEIPAAWRVPFAYVEIDNSKAVGGVPIELAKILVIGQRLATGTKAEGEPVRIVDPDQAIEYFGRGSMLADMCRWVKAANRVQDVWAIALDDDGAGTAAVKSVKFGGAATQAGTLNLYVAGTRVRIAITASQTSAEQATAFAAAVNALADLPCTAAVDGVDDTKVNLTFRHKGEVGTDLDIRANYYSGEKTPAGLTVTIADETAGAGNPDITTALDGLSDTEKYKYILHPYADAANLTALETELTARFGPMEAVASHAFVGVRGTSGSLATLGDSRNSPHSVLCGRPPAPQMPWVQAALIAGVVAGAAEIDPARPFQTLPLPGLKPPAEGDRFDPTERNLLLFDGIATTYVDEGGVERIERVVTTYQSNAYGSADPSYLDLNTLLTLDFLRRAWVARVTQRYARHKLAGDDVPVPPGAALVTPRVMRGEAVAFAADMRERGLVEDLDDFKANLVVERDEDDVNRLNVLLPFNVVNQLRVLAAQIQFRL